MTMYSAQSVEGAALTWDFFRDLPDEKNAFFQAARKRQIKKRETLFVEGSATNSVFYIAEGKVILTQVSSGGKEIVLYIHKKGALIGVAGSMSGLSRIMTARALTDVTFYELSNTEFKPMIAKNPVINERLVRQLSISLNFMASQYSSAFSEDAETRLTKLLSRLFSEELLNPKHDNNPGSISLMTTLDQLAGAIGASKSMVSRVLQRMQAEGLIEKSSHRITFLKPEHFISNMEIIPPQGQRLS
jgi:CRP-like cAMP-binding protein